MLRLSSLVVLTVVAFGVAALVASALVANLASARTAGHFESPVSHGGDDRPGRGRSQDAAPVCRSAATSSDDRQAVKTNGARPAEL